MAEQKKNHAYPFVVFASLFFVAVFVIENINDRFWLNDFNVYYSAVQAFLSGEKIYGAPFGLSTGYYKYSPFALLLFAPDALLPYHVAAIVHFIALAVSAIACMLIIHKILSNYVFQNEPAGKNLLMSIALACVAIHLVRELHLGNVNIMVLLMLSFTLLSVLEERYFLAGALIAVAALLKPYFLIVLLPVILFRKWKVLLSFAGTITASDVICVLVFGYDSHLFLYREWIASLSAHSSYLQSNHTVQSLLESYFKQYLIHPSLIIITAAGLLFTVLIFAAQKRTQSKNHLTGNRTFIAVFFCLLALVPNLVITDTQHFLLSLPLLMMLLYYLSFQKNKLLWVMFFIVVLFYTVNSTDLLGKTLASRFDSLGLLGISNLIIISSVVYLYLFNNKVFSTRR